MAIQKWRKQIDGIDRELLRLLNRRARLALRVGAVKKMAGLGLRDPAREREILRHVVRLNPGPLDERAVADLFRRIIRESRRLEARALRGRTPREAGE